MGQQLARARLGQIHQQFEVLVVVQFAPFFGEYSADAFSRRSNSQTSLLAAADG